MKWHQVGSVYSTSKMMHGPINIRYCLNISIEGSEPFFSLCGVSERSSTYSGATCVYSAPPHFREGDTNSCMFARGVYYCCRVESEIGLYQGIIVNGPVPRLMKIRWGGSVIFGICRERQTGMQTNAVLMSSFVELHVVNSQNDSPDSILYFGVMNSECEDW